MNQQTYLNLDLGTLFPTLMDCVTALTKTTILEPRLVDTLFNCSDRSDGQKYTRTYFRVVQNEDGSTKILELGLVDTLFIQLPKWIKIYYKLV